MEENYKESHIEDVKYEIIEDPIEQNFQPSFMEPVEEDFGEVLQLTEWSGESESKNSITNFVDSEYSDIDLMTVSKAQENLAKSFINKVEKFLVNLDGESALSKEQQNYLSVVAKLELNKLADLMTLTEVNKLLLDNLVRRINSVQAEDYAMIQTYNTLVNQHIKLHREVSNAYRAAPATIRKLKADVIGDNIEAINNQNKAPDDGLITQDFGSTQFNSSKQMLKNLEEQKKKRLENQNP